MSDTVENKISYQLLIVVCMELQKELLEVWSGYTFESQFDLIIYGGVCREPKGFR
jgi:hypothetical protein